MAGRLARSRSAAAGRAEFGRTFRRAPRSSAITPAARCNRPPHPHSQRFNEKIEDITAHDMRQVQYPAAIAGGNGIAWALAVIVRALRAASGTRADQPPEALVIGIGGTGVDMLARAWIDLPWRCGTADAPDDVIAAVKRGLFATGVGLSFAPTWQVLRYGRTGVGHGHGGRQREGWPGRRGGSLAMPWHDSEAAPAAQPSGHAR